MRETIGSPTPPKHSLRSVGYVRWGTFGGGGIRGAVGTHFKPVQTSTISLSNTPISILIFSNHIFQKKIKPPRSRRLRSSGTVGSAQRLVPHLPLLHLHAQSVNCSKRTKQNRTQNRADPLPQLVTRVDFPKKAGRPANAAARPEGWGAVSQ